MLSFKSGEWKQFRKRLLSHLDNSRRDRAANFASLELFYQRDREKFMKTINTPEHYSPLAPVEINTQFLVL
jgi:hypothetical protein